MLNQFLSVCMYFFCQIILYVSTQIIKNFHHYLSRFFHVSLHWHTWTKYFSTLFYFTLYPGLYLYCCIVAAYFSYILESICHIIWAFVTVLFIIIPLNILSFSLFMLCQESHATFINSCFKQTICVCIYKFLYRASRKKWSGLFVLWNSPVCFSVLFDYLTIR